MDRSKKNAYDYQYAPNNEHKNKKQRSRGRSNDNNDEHVLRRRMSSPFDKASENKAKNLSKHKKLR